MVALQLHCAATTAAGNWDFTCIAITACGSVPRLAQADISNDCLQTRTRRYNGLIRGLLAPAGPVREPELEKAIRAALDKLGRTEAVRKIAARFGVDPGRVQKISIRPFAGGSVAT
jgi:hypothetical protein